MFIEDMLGTGWTTSGLARALGVDPSTVYRWRGRGQQLDRVTQLALTQLAATDSPAKWRGPDKAPLTYFILDGDAVKIGKSQDPASRLRDLQVGSVRSLRLLAVIDVAERTVHHACEAFHVRGEWYRWGPDLRKAIRRLLRDYPTVQLPECMG